jgi:hypothetical protein
MTGRCGCLLPIMSLDEYDLNGEVLTESGCESTELGADDRDDLTKDDEVGSNQRCGRNDCRGDSVHKPR